MALLPLLLHLLILTTTVTARNTTNCSEVERQALLAIKTGLSHAAATRLSSWKGFACCSWTGVSCTAGHVVKLDLRYPNHVHSRRSVSLLSPSLLHLTHLQYLDLSLNNFGSPIPTFIGSLTHLSYLNLSDAGFYGPIPQHLGKLTRLSSLDLSDNYYPKYTETRFLTADSLPETRSLTADSLTWLSALRSIQYLDISDADLSNATNCLNILTTLPSLSVLRLYGCQLSGNLVTLGHFNLTSLTVLDLYYNNLGGTIPATIGNLTSLTVLDLSSNYLSGTIPTTMGNLANLQSLYLADNNFTGIIPDTFGHFNLTSLTVLELSYNNLGGTIPTIIGNLTSLTVLELSNNQLGGTIPATIGNFTNLQLLDLSYNNFTGIIPDTLGNLCNLTYLDISVNNLASGTSEFIKVLSQCNPARLGFLDMSYNMFTGYLTEYVGGFQSLHELYLANNMFNGSIPISIGRLSALVEISLGFNSFTGEVTEAHLSNLVNLKLLDLSYNSLIVNVSESWLPPFKAEVINLISCKVGPKFPTWLRNQTSLTQLDLSRANISDIPSWFVELLPALHYLYLNLSSNQLSGEFPRIMNFNSIDTLDLSHNKFEGLLPKLNTRTIINISYNNFSGPISKFLSGMEKLPKILILSHNRLNGSISPSICAANSLVIDLSYNEFSGELPDCWGSSSSTLQIVDFSNNKLSGKIPSSMGNLNQLKTLHLSDNRLTGEIPLSLQNFTELVTLDLGNNNLHGNIPSWIGACLRMLKVLRLRSNMLHGNIPVQLSLLTSLQILDLGNNSLSGVLPPSLGNLTAFQTINHNISALYSIYDILSYQQFYSEDLFVYTKGDDLEYTNTLSLVVSIDMSSNRLTGEIPDELIKLRGLVFLNLSNNHLRGGIPNGIGQLEKLESLDMSMNELSGSIPHSITSLYSLETLRLSNNNLAGPIPLGGQMSTFSESSFSNNDNLCGPPLPKKCSNDKPSDGGVEEDEDNDGDGDGDDDDDDDSETIWNLIIGFAPGLVVGFWTFIGVTMIKSSTRYAYFQFIDRIINLCM